MITHPSAYHYHLFFAISIYNVKVQNIIFFYAYFKILKLTFKNQMQNLCISIDTHLKEIYSVQLLKYSKRVVHINDKESL